LLLRKRAFASLLGVHFFVKFGDDSVSHIVMLNQNVAHRWKSHVPPVPAWFGFCDAFFGSVTR
jgi:hypothetical protein